ncbi:MafB family polymorphic toxin, partial [Neisseria sicca]|uniref:MafB family polymorphic toxin n=1 Tax=Neisseria sicca TaxID=490 RepID=UPI0034D97470
MSSDPYQHHPPHPYHAPHRPPYPPPHPPPHIYSYLPKPQLTRHTLLHHHNPSTHQPFPHTFPNIPKNFSHPPQQPNKKIFQHNPPLNPSANTIELINPVP